MIGTPAGYRSAPVTWTLICVNVAMWLFLTIDGGSENPATLIRRGAKFGPPILDGEWWRLVTPMFLHIGMFHLVANTIGLIAFGGAVEQVYGRYTFAGIYVCSGILGNIASFWGSPALGAGASGAVFGIVGAYGVYLLLNRRMMGQIGRQALISVGFIIAINMIFGLVTTGIDNLAHLGGLSAGAALGFALAPRERRSVRRPGNFCVGAVPAQTTVYRPGQVATVAVLAAAAVGLLALAYLAKSSYN